MTSNSLKNSNEPSTSNEDEEEEPKELSFAKALTELKKCQWYWGNLSASHAERLLRDTRPGTFLLRDSRSDHYFFSFTYQTEGGIFHTHLGLFNGRFCLGGPNSLVKSNSLVKFVEMAMKSSKDKNNYHILMHPNPARTQERTAAVDLQFPFNRCSLLPSLKYLCRVVIRHSIRSEADIPSLPLPKALKQYVASSRYLSPV